MTKFLSIYYLTCFSKKRFSEAHWLSQFSVAHLRFIGGQGGRRQGRGQRPWQAHCQWRAQYRPLGKGQKWCQRRPRHQQEKVQLAEPCGKCGWMRQQSYPCHGEGHPRQRR